MLPVPMSIAGLVVVDVNRCRFAKPFAFGCADLGHPASEANGAPV